MPTYRRRRTRNTQIRAAGRQKQGRRPRIAIDRSKAAEIDLEEIVRSQRIGRIMITISIVQYDEPTPLEVRYRG